MNKEQIDTAVREGIPFAVNMADGKTYIITNAHQIHAYKTRVVIVEDEPEIVHVLPLLTITGITYIAKPTPQNP